MSVITDVVIIAGSGERDALAHLNRWLAENDTRSQQLCEISLKEGGGSKATSVTAYAACFNFLDIGGFTEAVRGAPWRMPSMAVAYFEPESGETFVMSPARPDEWRTGT